MDIERKILARPDIELKDYQYRDAAHVKEITADCDVLVTQYADINREVIENLAHCRMIIRYAIGVDNIDLAAASERGIPVVNVPDYGIDEVSTYAVTLLLCAARKIPQTIDMIRGAGWNYAITRPMYRTAGKTVGLIGFGRIPRAVARKLSGFDMQILAYDPFVSEESAKERGVKLDDLMKPAGVASKTTLRKYLKEPLSFQMKCVIAICKWLRIPREEFLAIWDY